jgi:hypothetical protein
MHENRPPAESPVRKDDLAASEKKRRFRSGPRHIVTIRKKTAGGKESSERRTELHGTHGTPRD